MYTQERADTTQAGDLDAAAVRSDKPIPAWCPVYYFELTVIDKGQSGYIALGLTSPSVSTARLPGWETKGSYGWHGDDGRLFNCSGQGQPWGPQWSTGDVVGCGVDSTALSRDELSSSSSKATTAGPGGDTRVFFTKNGKFLGWAFHSLDRHSTPLYPSVGLRTPGEVVRANFGGAETPFVFDIVRFVTERQEAARHAASVAHSIPRALLDPTTTTTPPTTTTTTTTPLVLTHVGPFVKPSQDQVVSDTLSRLILSYLHFHGLRSSAHALSHTLASAHARSIQGMHDVPGLRCDDACKDAYERELRSDAGAGPGAARTRLDVCELVRNGQVARAVRVLRRELPSLLLLPTLGTAAGTTGKRQEPKGTAPNGRRPAQPGRPGRRRRQGRRRRTTKTIIVFKLRLRHFVEQACSLASAAERVAESSSTTTTTAVKAAPSSSAAAAAAAKDEERMDVTTSGSGEADDDDDDDDEAFAEAHDMLELLALGRALQRDFTAYLGDHDGDLDDEGDDGDDVGGEEGEAGDAGDDDADEDERTTLRTQLGVAFSLLAYSAPLDSVGGAVSALVSQRARDTLAAELNEAMLKAQGLPMSPPLERLARHNAAVRSALAELGVGAALLLRPLP